MESDGRRRMSQRNRPRRRQGHRAGRQVPELDFVSLVNEVRSAVHSARTLAQVASVLKVDVDVVARADESTLLDLVTLAIAERAAIAGHEVGLRDGRAQALAEAAAA
jgi:hypothetical protein